MQHTTSDWLTSYANQKFGNKKKKNLKNLAERDKKCSQEWLVNTDPDIRYQTQLVKLNFITKGG